MGHVEYGKDAIKIHLGIILSINNCSYNVPLCSAKTKYEKMGNSKDIFKIKDPETKKIYGVLNINNMIPVPSDVIKILKYNEISNYRSFSSDLEKMKTISLLQKEFDIIFNYWEHIEKNAKHVYKMKHDYPNGFFARRCCEFSLLEDKCLKWKEKSLFHS